jgi:hypothetical protein
MKTNAGHTGLQALGSSRQATDAVCNPCDDVWSNRIASAAAERAALRLPAAAVCRSPGICQRQRACMHLRPACCRVSVSPPVIVTGQQQPRFAHQHSYAHLRCIASAVCSRCVAAHGMASRLLHLDNNPTEAKRTNIHHWQKSLSPLTGRCSASSPVPNAKLGAGAPQRR